MRVCIHNMHKQVFLSLSFELLLLLNYLHEALSFYICRLVQPQESLKILS